MPLDKLLQILLVTQCLVKLVEGKTASLQHFEIKKSHFLTQPSLTDDILIYFR